MGNAVGEPDLPTVGIMFPTGIGMAQGDVASPFKFVATQDPLARWLSKHGRGITIGMHQGFQVTVVSLHFCDDMVLY